MQCHPPLLSSPFPIVSLSWTGFYRDILLPLFLYMCCLYLSPAILLSLPVFCRFVLSTLRQFSCPVLSAGPRPDTEGPNSEMCVYTLSMFSWVTLIMMIHNPGCLVSWSTHQARGSPRPDHIISWLEVPLINQSF